MEGALALLPMVEIQAFTNKILQENLSWLSRQAVKSNLSLFRWIAIKKIQGWSKT